MNNYEQLKREQSIIVINNMLDDLFDNFNKPIQTNNLEFTSRNKMYRMTCNFDLSRLEISEPIIWQKGAIEKRCLPYEEELIKTRVSEFIRLKMVQL